MPTTGHPRHGPAEDGGPQRLQSASPGRRPGLRHGAGGPMWPRGMALHPNGSLIVVDGRHAQRLNRAHEPEQVATGGPMPGVVVPSPGWGQDLHRASTDRLARVWADRARQTRTEP